MWVGFGVLFAAALTGCQLLSGIDPTRPSADASADALVPRDAVSEASGDACVAGACAPELLYETDPGPTVVIAANDAVVFGVASDTYNGTPRELWKMPKRGGVPVRISSDVYCIGGHVDGEAIIALQPQEVTRVQLDGSGEKTLGMVSTPTNRTSVLFEGSIYWITRFDGVRKVPADGSAAATKVFSFDGPASLGLVVDANGFVIGDDTSGLYTAAKDGTNLTMVGQLPGAVGGMGKLDGVIYLTTTIPVPSVWRFDGVNLTTIASNPGLITPGAVVVRAPFVYVSDLAGYGKDVGAIWRYEPSKDAWIRLVTARYPYFTLDDTHLYYSERVSNAAPTLRQLWRVPL